MSYFKSIILIFALVFINPLNSAPKKTSFELGYDLYEKKSFEEAKVQFNKSLKESEVLKTYALYYLASIEFELGAQSTSENLLKSIFNSKPVPSEELKNRSLFLYSKIQENKKDYKEARISLANLSRTWKYSPHYPEVLYNLTRVEMQLKRTKAACVYARTLYSQYPQDELLAKWDIDLRSNKIGETPVHCEASLKDVGTRIRRLQLSGQAERARTEALNLRKTLSGKEARELDLIYSRFLVNEGMIDEALAILMKQYTEGKEDFDYLMQLAFAAARGGEARTAIGAYEKAHKLSPRSREGREALFQAAFLSYQFQDYDGAIRKFTELIKLHSHSGLARDAKWHLAWLNYLRSDFKGAIESFRVARAENQNRRRGRSSALDEKLLYWESMAQLRLNQTEEAEKGFLKIIQDGPYSFYSLLSRARLEQFAADKVNDKKNSDQARVPAVATWREFSGTQTVRAEDEESEEQLAESEEPSTVNEEGVSEPVNAANESDEIFKDAKSLERLQAAQSLMSVGQAEWARWELYEIEKKSRSSQVRRKLISLYEQLGAHHRSARIAELYFGMERQKFGLQGAEGLWQSMFPKAFESSVKTESSRHGIPKEWVWAIMRAESLFRPDVISPVGAKGLMQIMPYTGANLARLRGDKTFDVQDLFKAETNISLGSQYLARLGQMFSKSLPVVAASYNAGPHRVKGWLMNFGHLEVDEFIEHIPFLETRNYVKKVLGNQFYYQALYEKNLKPERYMIQPLGVAIPQKISARENWDTL